MERPQTEVTVLLREWRQGDSAALDRLTPLIYDELRRLAASYLRRERSGHTLQPTALVHEAYLRLADVKHPDWQDRSHFIGIAAHLMRQVLMEHARGKNAQKRGGGQPNLSLIEGLVVSADGSAELEALDDALEDLAKCDERLAKLIELRYFGGLQERRWPG